jgi:hypothetical protein
MMVIGYPIQGDGWYAMDAPDGATDDEIEASIIADISQDAYSPYGATLEIRWESSDGRSGRLEHTIEPDVDAIMQRLGIETRNRG